VILCSGSHGTHDLILLPDSSGSLQLREKGREREEKEGGKVVRDTKFWEGGTRNYISGFEVSQTAHMIGINILYDVGRAALK
jgi:hypothetical protein